MNPTLAALVPVFGVIALGWALRRTGLVAAPLWGGINRLSYQALMPAMLFSTIVAADFAALPAGPFLIAAVAGFVAMGVITMGFRLIPMPGPVFTSLFQGGVRWNGFVLLALAPAAFGPEILIGDLPEHIEGKSRILRDGKTIWEKPFLSGEANMSHTIDNLEHHHFKYDIFRQPGDVHVHMFGTATLSFADGISTEQDDVFEIEAPQFGLPLRNRVTVDKTTDKDALVKVAVL